MIMAFPCGDRGGIAVVGRDAVLGPVSGEPFLEPCRAACFPSVAVSAPRLAPRSTTRLDEIDFALPDTISATSASATQIHRFPNFTVLHRFSGYAERWKGLEAVDFLTRSGVIFGTPGTHPYGVGYTQDRGLYPIYTRVRGYTVIVRFFPIPVPVGYRCIRTLRYGISGYIVFIGFFGQGVPDGYSLYLTVGEPAKSIIGYHRVDQ